MLDRPRTALLALAGVALLGGSAALAAGQLKSGESTLDKKVPVGVDASGRQWLLGGFSGLYPLGGNRFASLTDRGPNDDITCGDVDGKVIYVPAYAPRLIFFSVKGKKLQLDRVEPFRVGTALATGVANLPSDESSFTETCAPIPNDPFGVDTEGLGLDPRVSPADVGAGTAVTAKKPPIAWWVADEYRPSILGMSADGAILERITPGGATGSAYAASVAQAEQDSGNGFPVIQQFPAIVGDRFRHNRGFEDVAIQQIGKKTYVYSALQSPMENPDATTHNSLAVRVFRIDVTNRTKPVVDREWAYLLAPNPSKKGPLADKISSIMPAGPDKLLIEERDDTPTDDPDASTRLYTVDFTGATNLLGGTWDDEATSPTLEQLYLTTTDGVTPPNPAGVTPGAKSLCVDVDHALTAAGLANVKLEGMSVVDANGTRSLAAIDDNDFDLAHQTDPSGNPDSLPTKLDIVPLPGTC